MKIKAIIFDMDGVLIEAKEWHYEALNKALRLFGMEISRYEHLSTFDGLPTKDKLEMLSLTQNLPRALHKFINEMKQIYTMAIIHAECKPTFTHEFALSRLRANGYKMAVCSNSIRSSIEVMMQKASLMQYLDFFLSNEDVLKAKPDPQMYNLAISRFNLNPKECLILEDNENGIKAARASGANVLEIDTPADVNLENIMNAVKKFESGENQ